VDVAEYRDACFVGFVNGFIGDFNAPQGVFTP